MASSAFWLTLVAFVCALGPLVFFHELGHYLVARMFKIPAEVFRLDSVARSSVGPTDKARAGRSVGSRLADMSGLLVT